jgi:hypothetical protein
MDASRAPISFTSSLRALPQGQYTLTSKTYRDAYNPSFREELFYFYIGPTPPPQTPPAATMTPSPTATPTPPPTPTPPQPAVPNASFKVSLHSTLDPLNSDSDPRNGVYKSNGNQIS